MAFRSPKEPTFEYYDHFPLTDNDEPSTDRVAAALTAELGADRVLPLERLTGSEDFSEIPNGLGAPYTYWVIGGFPEGSGPVPNHNPRFAPVIQPTLTTGTRAAVAAALAWLAPAAGVR